MWTKSFSRYTHILLVSAIAKPMEADQILAVAVRMAGKVITARVT